MTHQEAKKLFEKYNQGLATVEEQILLEQWYHQEQTTQRLTEEDAKFILFKDEIWRGTLIKAGLDPQLGAENATDAHESKIRRFNKWLAAACIILPLMFAVGYFVMKKTDTTQIANTTTLKENIILPGGNRAVLKLADGSTIDLNDRKNGLLANQNKVVITKNKDGQITYGNSDDENVALMNTLSTPNGGTYQVDLPDGTKVWLNAASSLKYPTVFKGKERLVELIGEAYFEVAKDKKHPFVVTTNNQEVEVLGTHFNINAYSDEANVKTTLLEGRVRVSGNNKQVILQPNQQAVFSDDIQIKNVDAEGQIAWKKGEFNFQNNDLKTIMRQLERWYSIQVKYQGNFDKYSFGGSTFRNENLSEVLKVLELSGIKFKAEGKTITVYQ